MFKGLKKEFVVKRNVKKIMLASIIDALILSILFYIAIADCNEFLVKLLQAIAEKNAAYEVSWLMLPCLIIVTLIINLTFFIIHDETALEEAKKEIKEKQVKKEPKTKKVKTNVKTKKQDTK